MKLLGRSIIGDGEGALEGEMFYAFDPSTGERLAPGFGSATPEEVKTAVQLACCAFPVFGRVPGKERGRLLRSIAANIEAIGEEIVERAERETALSRSRLQSETDRTCKQLRLFAEIAGEGSWSMARIDLPDRDRKPVAKPDVRSLLRPLGPVAVFAASNFPLAFSVAGGDTASALAAGNPVIVKAHPAHPGTSELVGRAVQKSVREGDLPDGIFSMLLDSGTQAGAALVKHPSVKAVGFTGSCAVGRELMHLAASRTEPIPFFAEMSSVNPVFILPGALQERREELAGALFASFTLGAGQFCTKPGVLFLPDVDGADQFIRQLREMVTSSPLFRLLTPRISAFYCSAVAKRRSISRDFRWPLYLRGKPSNPALHTPRVLSRVPSGPTS